MKMTPTSSSKYQKLFNKFLILLADLTSSTQKFPKERVFAWFDSAFKFTRAAPRDRFTVMLRSHILGLASAIERRGWEFPKEMYVEAYALPKIFRFTIGDHEYEFSLDLFSRNIPKWRKELKGLFAGPRTLLEIGSFEGFSSCWLAEHALREKGSSLTCVDPFLDDCYKTFKRNIKRSGKSRQIFVKRGSSRKILPHLKTESYDFIYVDGDHTLRAALWDTRRSWKLLKPGGILIVDDYDLFDFKSRRFPVKDAVETLLKELKSEVEVIRKDNQAVMIKRPSRPRPSLRSQDSRKQKRR